MVAAEVRIGLLSPFYPPFEGGAERVAERVAQMLTERGYTLEIHTLQHDAALPQWQQVGGVSITRHPFTYRRLGGFTDIHSPSLVSAMKTWEVDIVHLHSLTFPTLLKRATRPLKRRGIPVMLVPHGLFETLTGSHVGPKSLLYRSLVRGVLKGLFRDVSALGALSNFDLESLAGAGITVSDHEILFNGVDIPSCVPNGGSQEGPLKLLHVASIKPNKGHLDVLQALATTGLEVQYHIVGSGGALWQAHEARVERTVTALGLERNVVRHGRVDDEVRDQLYRDADVVIVPSHAETFPLAVLEGMSYRKAVIATEVGGVADLIEHRRSGLLIPPAQPEEISRALLELHSPHAREALGQQAFDKVRANFSWSCVVDRYETLTKRMLAAPRF